MWKIKLNCNCGLSYIEQTGRKIEKFAVAEHTISLGHKIDQDKTNLLHNNYRYKNRVITEAIETHRHKHKIKTQRMLTR